MLGCAVLCLGPEDMSVRECCYYLTVSMTTVGYGDVAPTTVGGKLFMMPYTLIGLAVCFPIAMDAGEVVHKWLEGQLMRLADDNPDDNRSPQWVKGVLAIFMIIVPLVIGVTYFSLKDEPDCEWERIDALWWTFMTVTTVGYGDLSLCHPKTDMVFLIGYIIVSVVFVAAAITTLSTLHADVEKERREAELLASFNINIIRDLDTDGDGVDENEYVLGMLAAMGHIDPDIVDRYRRQFKRYDVDGSGKLTQEDLDMVDSEYQQSATKAKEDMNNKGLKRLSQINGLQSVRSSLSPTNSPPKLDASDDVGPEAVPDEEAPGAEDPQARDEHKQVEFGHRPSPPTYDDTELLEHDLSASVPEREAPSTPDTTLAPEDGWCGVVACGEFVGDHPKAQTDATDSP